MWELGEEGWCQEGADPAQGGFGDLVAISQPCFESSCLVWGRRTKTPRELSQWPQTHLKAGPWGAPSPQ